MMMTMRRLSPLVAIATRKDASAQSVAQMGAALKQRRAERGSSKLGRRLRRKHVAGRAGAF